MKVPCQTCITFPICQTKILPIIYPVRPLSFRKNIYDFCLECYILKNYIKGYKYRGGKPNNAFNSVVDFFLGIGKKKEDTQHENTM